MVGKRNRMPKPPTGFIGYMLDQNSPLYDKITTIQKKLQCSYKDFKPQKYPHTTMIYFGRTYIEDIEELSKDKNFRYEIAKFKDCVCEFDGIEFIGNCLIYVYKFTDVALWKTLQDLTGKYEKHYHTQYLHITVGLFNNDDKAKFMEENKAEVEATFKGTSFVIDLPHGIMVDSGKTYHHYGSKDLFET